MILKKARSLIFVLAVLATSALSFGQIAVSVTFAPPALPVYEQPICPGDGYFWTPGFWAYADDDYYWVPGTWVQPPEPGLFWTPGYWAWSGDGFGFYDGYWATQVGFYGGINYGFGYFGEGYEGGRWDHDRFFYNRAVNNVNVTEIHNVYNTTVVNNTNVNRVSYNGGNGGINSRPRPEEEAVARGRHIPPVAAQTEHFQAARSNPEQRASANHGKPPVAATSQPGALRGNGVVAAKEAGAPYNPERNRSAQRPAAASPRAEGARPDASRPQGNAVMHANDIPHGQPIEPPNTGNAKQDRKLQEQQQKMQAKQEQERQKLQQKQDQDHQRLAQRNADEARKQQVEQRHQQQTQQLQSRHEQQQQRMQQRIQPPPQRNRAGN